MTTQINPTARLNQKQLESNLTKALAATADALKKKDAAIGALAAAERAVASDPGDTRLRAALHQARENRDIADLVFRESKRGADDAQERIDALKRETQRARFAELMTIATRDGLRAACADDVAAMHDLYAQILAVEARVAAKVDQHSAAATEAAELAPTIGESFRPDIVSVGWVQSECRDALSAKRKPDGVRNVRPWFGVG